MILHRRKQEMLFKENVHNMFKILHCLLLQIFILNQFYCVLFLLYLHAFFPTLKYSLLISKSVFIENCIVVKVREAIFSGKSSYKNYLASSFIHLQCNLFCRVIFILCFNVYYYYRINAFLKL